MKEEEIRILFTEYNDIKELSADDRKVAEASLEAAKKAYAPYSEFKVGAAILLSDGTIVRGANVENAAYPSGSCAEKTALSYTVSNFPELHSVTISIAAMSGDNLTDEPVPPCGNCRQMLLEEEQRLGREIRIILVGSKRVIVLKSSGALMPLQFTKKNLKRGNNEQ